MTRPLRRELSHPPAPAMRMTLVMQQQPAMRQVQIQRPELPRPPPPFKMPEEFEIKPGDNGSRRVEKKKLQACVGTLKTWNKWREKREALDVLAATAIVYPKSDFVLPCMQIIYDAARSRISGPYTIRTAMTALNEVICSEGVRDSAKGREAFTFYEQSLMRMRRGRAGIAQQSADVVVHELVENKEEMFTRLSPELIGTTKALDWKRGDVTTEEDFYCYQLRDWSHANSKSKAGPQRAASRAIAMLDVLDGRKEICLAQRAADKEAIETHFGHYIKAVCGEMSPAVARWVLAINKPE